MSTNGYNNVNEIAPAMFEHPGAWPMSWRLTDMRQFTSASIPESALRLVGQRFSRWTVLRFSHSAKTPSGSVRHMLFCRCDCGTERPVWSWGLIYGTTHSCGCLSREVMLQASTKHGKAQRGNVHPVYKAWQEMHRRCTNPNRPGWEDYGGRGITVCDRWKSFPDFSADMFPNWRRGLTLGRIENDGPYSPENCRWETKTEQNNNTRRNRLVTAHGKTQTVGEWATELGVPYSLLLWRLDEGWNHERIISQPSRKKERG